MNLLDMLSISLHYFRRKWIGATNENSNFDLKVKRSKGGFRRAYKRRDISEGVDNQNRKSASKQSAPVLIKIRFTCTGVCPIMISCWCIINNGNWTEWSAIWSEIIRVVSKSQIWFQTKIARHEVQLPLYYVHFEIAEFSQY